MTQTAGHGKRGSQWTLLLGLSALKTIEGTTRSLARSCLLKHQQETCRHCNVPPACERNVSIPALCLMSAPAFPAVRLRVCCLRHQKVQSKLQTPWIPEEVPDMKRRWRVSKYLRLFVPCRAEKGLLCTHSPLLLPPWPCPLRRQRQTSLRCQNRKARDARGRARVCLRSRRLCARASPRDRDPIGLRSKPSSHPVSPPTCIAHHVCRQHQPEQEEKVRCVSKGDAVRSLVLTLLCSRRWCLPGRAH